MIKVAIIGDRFMRASVFEAALRKRISADIEVSSIETDWPDTPFHGRNGPAGPAISEYQGEEARVIEIVADAQVAITHLAPFSRKVVESCKQLRLLGLSRGSSVNVDLDAARERNIVVTNVPGRNASAVAEFTIAQILSLTRKLSEGNASLSAGHWQGELYRSDRTGEELSQLAVGIIGYGAIGQRVVRLLKPFGCRILVYDKYAELNLSDLVDGVEKVDLEFLLANSDVISLHARATPETEGMLGAREFSLMRHGAYLINNARASMVVASSLRAALKSGQLAGAALDTFDPEPPLANDEILAMPNVTVTPHIAGASRFVTTFAAERLAEEVARFLQDGSVKTRVA